MRLTVKINCRFVRRIGSKKEADQACFARLTVNVADSCVTQNV